MCLTVFLAPEIVVGLSSEGKSHRNRIPFCLVKRGSRIGDRSWSWCPCWDKCSESGYNFYQTQRIYRGKLLATTGKAFFHYQQEVMLCSALLRARLVWQAAHWGSVVLQSHLQPCSAVPVWANAEGMEAQGTTAYAVMGLDKTPPINQAPGSSVTANTAQGSVTCGVQNTLSRKTSSGLGECRKGLEVGGTGAECDPQDAMAVKRSSTSHPCGQKHSLREGRGGVLFTFPMAPGGCQWTQVRPGGWKGSVSGVFAAQLDAALNAVLWTLCERSDQRHPHP